VGIEELEPADLPDFGEVIQSHEIAIMDIGRKVIELETQIKTLERALRYHVTDLDTAHKF
jgi:hypothetical protein